MLHKGVFVAGTDTGVGKTLVATALVRALRQQGTRVAVMKPVAAGAEKLPEGLRNADAMALIEASGMDIPYDIVNPYCFAPPISPHIGAREAGVAIDPELVRTRFTELAKDAEFVVVEGAGGWLAPIGPTQTMADIALALDLPVLLVVGLRLGCLNHALLTAQSIEARGARLAAWVGNHVEFHFERDMENLTTLQMRLGRPPLDVLRFNPTSPERVGLSSRAQAAALDLLARRAS